MKLTALKTAIRTQALAVSGINDFKFSVLTEINTQPDQDYDCLIWVYPEVVANVYTKGYQQKTYNCTMMLYRNVDKDAVQTLEDTLADNWEEMQAEFDEFFQNMIANYEKQVAFSTINFSYDYLGQGRVTQYIQATFTMQVNDCD